MYIHICTVKIQVVNTNRTNEETYERICTRLNSSHWRRTRGFLREVREGICDKNII